MIYLLSYYIIGVIVSLYFAYYYRYSKLTKTKPMRSDAIGGIVGPWLFPLQIILHFIGNKQK
jgi:hypothetical protein